MDKKMLNWFMRTVLVWLLLGQIFPVINASGEDRKTKLDFEDELVEGVNKKPYDSLSALSDKSKDDDDAHLYFKRKEFVKETKETIAELKYLQ